MLWKAVVSKYFTQATATVMLGVLVCSAPGRLQAQQQEPEVVWTNIERDFYVQDIGWNRNYTNLTFVLRSKKGGYTKIQGYAYKNGQFDDVDVIVSTRIGQMAGMSPGVLMWTEGEAETASVKVRAGTVKVELKLVHPLPQ